ncbi:MAG TPA: class IV adenylate cyclase [Tissierellaceae bacterium]|nr:class IV adenylate cyclase [Tissierellaceae bacterium]
MERELEVKVLGMDLDELEDKVKDLGGKLIAKELQENTLIDSKDKPIKSYLDGYLRVRETKDLLDNKVNVNLTLKKNINLDGLRDNIELNAKVEDKEMMIKILDELGFNNIEIGHKERKSYRLKEARIDFDKWDERTYPFPYLEIEVKDRKHLNEIITLLEIPQENISTKSIVELRNELELL